METATAQNCTFASPNTQADASACKRAVFLPTHPSPPTTHKSVNNFLSVFYLKKRDSKSK
jgi:hypothetical protein